MEDKFKDVLNEGEEISKILKPNKFVYVGGAVLSLLSGLLFFSIIVTIALIDTGEFYILFIPIILFAIAMVVTWIFMGISYKNTFYAITNKRLIVRSGIFGIDFKSMDLSDVSAVEPRVSVWVKIAGKHTGSILVGSLTRPILGYANSNNAYGAGSATL